MLHGHFLEFDGLPFVRGEIAHHRTNQMAGVVFLLDPASPITIVNAYDLARVGQRLLDMRARSRLFMPGASVPVGEVRLLIGFRHEPSRLAIYHSTVAVVPGSTTQPDFVSRLGWDVLQYWHTNIDPVADALRCDVRESDFDVPFPTP